ncbi:DNA-directed RNA polymerase [Oleoguttula sp. CCFEE 5521]
MLARRHTSQLLAASFAQLNLPWLAPAQLRWTATQAAAATTQPVLRPRKRNGSRGASTRQAQVRQLATAADAYTPSQAAQYPPPGYRAASPFKSSADLNVPWDASSVKASPPLSSLRPVGLPVLIDTSTMEEEPTIRVQSGIVGTTQDLVQHLHTSLRVGRMDRAENIVKRLAEMNGSASPEVVHAHAVFLEGMLGELLGLSRGSKDEVALAGKMAHWFEVEMYGKGVTLESEMLVTMIRSSLRVQSASSRDRAVRRFVEMARQLGDEMHDEVLNAEDYDDNEFALLGAATSEFYEEIEEELPASQDLKQAVAEARETMIRPDKVSSEELPEVLATEQKGEGLEYIKKAMQAFTDSALVNPGATIEEQRKLADQRQVEMEKNSADIALERWRKADEELRKIGIISSMQSKPVGALMWQWFTALMPVLEQELAEVKKVLATPSSRDLDRLSYGPYLEILPLRKIAASTILHTMGIITRGKDHHSSAYQTEAKLGVLTISLGKAIEQECIVANAFKTTKGREHNNTARQRRRASNNRRGQRRLQAAASASDKSAEQKLKYSEWPSQVKVKLGAMLLSKLIETAQMPVTKTHPRTKAKITQMQPAFLHRQKYMNGKRFGMFTPNPALVTKVQSEPITSLMAKRMPMIVEPKPWTGWQEGGYYQYPSSILRLTNGEKSAKDYFTAAHEQGDMKQIYAGLTALGKTPWKINHDVLKVQLEAWNSGEAIANFAPLHPHIDVPAEPEPSTDPSPRRRWLTEVREIENRKSGYHSQRCFQNFQLEIARAVANETLYFPHNLDFRGRAYPIPPYLNHMGADNARGLLVFGEGKPLGAEGLRWLKIHLANVAGYDKASLQEREDYTMARLDDIYDSVRNPLNGKRWWLKSEDGWQTLAACFELVAALDSPDPHAFVSHLPLHQDGTCNGLQHYAALGGDKVGAAQVNLEPGDRPADIYTAVLNSVNEAVDIDAAKGDIIAKALQGKLTRKAVKQPVMTNVYGVTFYGAKEQVERQLRELIPDLPRYGPINYLDLSHYVASKIFASLGSMFTGAQAIQTWLGQAADRISTSLTAEQIERLTSENPTEPSAASKAIAGSKSAVPLHRKRGPKTKAVSQDVYSPTGLVGQDRLLVKSAKPLFKSTVIWTTPLRLPVVQPYRKSTSSSVTTSLQLIALQEPQVWDPVSKRKQLQAFPPNFIHSLDATHMLLSALKCDEVGMTFASIHDSFWTHASDIGRMSEVLRDAFVAMHSEDIIGRLREEFVTRYKGCMYMASFSGKSAVGHEICRVRKELKSSLQGKSGELALEMERLKLLVSEDAEERAKGEAMVTPGSLAAKYTDISAQAVPADMAGQTLGAIPGQPTPVSAASEDIDFDNADVEATNTDADDLDARVLVEGEDSLEALKTKKQSIKDNKVYVWLPLEFPAVPEKGGFDVRRLRQSKYFFH